MPHETAGPSEPTVTYQYSTAGTSTEWPRPQWPPRGMPTKIADQLRIEALERRIAKLERRQVSQEITISVIFLMLAVLSALVVLWR